MVWFTTFRLITWAYILLWEKIDDMDLNEYLPVFYLFQVLICIFLLRIKDPIHLYKKLAPTYNLFSFVDFIFMTTYLSWWTGAFGVVWYLLLFYVLPRYHSRIHEISEWKLSVSIAIEVMCYHMLSFWPMKKIGILHVVYKGLRPLFVSDAIVIYVVAVFFVLPPLATIRYLIARRFNDVMMRKITGEFKKVETQKDLDKTIL